MRYFLDTEFIEDGKTIDLISIGIVAHDGREFYRETSGCYDFHKANSWVRANVFPQLQGGWVRRTRAHIRQDLLEFIGADPKPEFWAYYADYDWVALCQLFGTMTDLPKGWPMYCRDIKQLADMISVSELPRQSTGEHNALADARWNKQMFDYLEARVPPCAYLVFDGVKEVGLPKS